MLALVSLTVSLELSESISLSLPPCEPQVRSFLASSIILASILAKSFSEITSTLGWHRRRRNHSLRLDRNRTGCLGKAPEEPQPTSGQMFARMCAYLLILKLVEFYILHPH